MRLLVGLTCPALTPRAEPRQNRLKRRRRAFASPGPKLAVVWDEEDAAGGACLCQSLQHLLVRPLAMNSLSSKN